MKKINKKIANLKKKRIFFMKILEYGHHLKKSLIVKNK